MEVVETVAVAKVIPYAEAAPNDNHTIPKTVVAHERADFLAWPSGKREDTHSK